ncbi:Peptidyl-prolyl cis-trans isomerase (rotamase)-cyclophilin family [Nannocystis exedens]|uniref:peptidylprolyl isomerase n=1 Tax=Nannocystis exedens TaxID=54 RepID=A0A1I2ASQ8_9BACT|nr:peptidylprolyl isomerase [Nannocystis exedens]PCC74240.1 peptidylprolyl isomerase [Nannocystis exedens]SFE46757.1 Peptidyl-prolyl cis-trans isomerase (rotamase)-cyclophilin family [Nannocystis exedens]
MEVPRPVRVLAAWSSLLVACARPPAPPGGEVHPGLSIARAEARREAGSSELVKLTTGPATSAAAIRGLGRIGDAVALARLGELLASPDEAARVAAMQALDVAGALGSEVAGFEAAVWQRWPQASPRERLAIVTATRRLGGPAASARLAAALGPGEAPEVREAAAIVLGILGRRELPLGDAARDGLVAMAGEREPRSIYAAVYGLAHAHAAGHDAGEAALLRATAAADPEARALALKGLARRKPPEALATMRAGLGDPDPWVRVAAVRGLGELADPAATAALWDWLRAELDADIVDGTGPGHPVLEAMSVLTAGKEAPPGAAEAHALAEARLAAARPEARRVRARLACGLGALAARAGEWRPPLRCAEAAGAAAEIDRLTFETGLIGQGLGGPAEARAARLTALAGHDDARVRAAALAAAAELWLERDVGGLIAAGLRDSSPAVAGTAAEAVQGRFAGDAPPEPPPAIVDALLERAGAERDAELFAGMAGALAEVGGARGLAVCRAALGDANASVRAAARACVKAASGEDPGVTGPAAPIAAPPHDPEAVLGHELLWRLHTERGRIDVALAPTAAPWHVAAIVALTQRGFYDGLTFHRVVPGYVVQGGDPGGTGWGGPGFTLPSEPGEAPFARGAVGIADAGKDTGGSQFFIMHARAPHLDGRYTHVGEVRDGLPAALALVVGDRILRAEVVIAPASPGR